METLPYTMSRWTTDDLIGEVVRRTATDGLALRSVEGAIIRARLATSDRRLVESQAPLELESKSDPGVVRGTIEMRLAEDGAAVGLMVSGGHEVDAATSGAHAHDHTHRRQSSTKFAAHLHHHLHPGEVGADAQLNGHTHARPRASLPWERPDSG